MDPRPIKVEIWLLNLVLVTLALPVFLYWFFVASAPSLGVDAARALLSKNGSVLLVDVRTTEEYKNNHIAEAAHWPLAEILRLQSTAGMPPQFQQKTLLMICNGGLSSARAANALKRLGVSAVHSVAGGLASWDTMANGKCSLLNLRPLALPEQWLAVITAFVVKPFYMTLAFILGLLLWRRQAPDLGALRRGFLVFWAGEAACALNYLFFQGASDFWEYLHNYGMALSFSFFAYAVLEGLDSRLLKVTDPREKCSALPLCRACIKYEKVACGLQRLFLFLIPAVCVLALLPLCAPFRTISYNSIVLGSVQNYTELASSQLFESRYCSVVALLLLAAAWLALFFNNSRGVYWSKVFFAGALGPLSFGFMRVFLLGTFSENLLWFIVWEEITEFLFITFVALTLWQFRRSLFALPVRQPDAYP